MRKGLFPDSEDNQISPMISIMPMFNYIPLFPFLEIDQSRRKASVKPPGSHGGYPAMTIMVNG